jgi:hypothetical protein
MGGRYDSIRFLSEAVSLLTDKGDVDQALNLIHDFVERIITDPLCTAPAGRDSFGKVHFDFDR